jgi:two-component system alkaline phosphatase synthesis response regulator PhoP/two-component system response regulator RpaA
LAESPAAIIVERGQWISLEAVMAAVRSVEGRAPIPVLVIGSAERASERFEAFEHGAVDFLAQPIDSLEVLWRLKAHLRLVQDDTQTIQVGDLCLDWRNHVVTVAGRTVSITPNECAILRHLLAQPGRAFDVESLLVGALQYPPQLGNPEIVRTHIRNLRSKVDREGARRILNIPRVGYVFEPQQACLNG